MYVYGCLFLGRCLTTSNNNAYVIWKSTVPVVVGLLILHFYCGGGGLIRYLIEEEKKYLNFILRCPLLIVFYILDSIILDIYGILLLVRLPAKHTYSGH